MEGSQSVLPKGFEGITKILIHVSELYKRISKILKHNSRYFERISKISKHISRSLERVPNIHLEACFQISARVCTANGG